MSGGETIAILLGLLIVGLVIFALIDRPLLRAFVRSVTRLELTATGLRLERAVTQVEEASKSKREAATVARDDLRTHMRGLQRPSAILWVDDNPDNNSHETSAFRSLGVTVDRVITNAAAAAALAARSYELVISDIGRSADEGDSAGLDVPVIVAKTQSPTTPIVFYTHRILDRVTLDGHPVAHGPTELLEVVTRLIGGPAA